MQKHCVKNQVYPMIQKLVGTPLAISLSLLPMGRWSWTVLLCPRPTHLSCYQLIPNHASLPYA